ncbi:WD40 repeat domain-containing protein [Streptomyces sp. NPDC002917]|uniref:WD40 repeat domain-containing protein n=1 Tax=Streptomyces sp. NPDC002917 TaxID=3364671 RepID=UPI0036C86B34
MNGPEEAIFRQLLNGLPQSGGIRRWDLAGPYLRRHAAEHAVRAGESALMQLFSDGEFLINAEPRAVAAALPPFRDDYPGPTRQILDAYCASLSWHLRVSARARRQILALDARRLGHRQLAERIEIGPGGTEPAWRCLWSTATNISASAGATMTGHAAGINDVLIADLPDTTLAITASADHTVRIWDLATGQARHVLLHTSPVAHVAATALEGRGIVLTASDRLVVWDPLSGEPLDYEDVGSTVRHLAPTEEGLVVLATGDGPLVVDLNRDSSRVRVTGAGRQARYVAVCREGRVRFGLSVTEGNFVTAFTLPGGEVLHRHMPRKADRITAQAVVDVGDQSIAVLGHASGACTVAHAHTGMILHTLQDAALSGSRQTRGAVTAIGLHASRSGWRAVVGHRDGTLRTWDLHSGELLRTAQAHAGPITVVITDTVGGLRVLLTASEDDTVRTWDAETGRSRDVLAGHTSDVTTAATATVRGRPVAVTASKDLTVRTWDLRYERPMEDPAGHANWVRAIGLHREDERMLAVTTCSDPFVRILDAGTGEALTRLAVPERDFLQTCAVFTHDGRTKIVAGGAGGILALWDYGTREREATIRMGKTPVNAVAVHAPAERPIQVIAGANDGTIALWEPQTGQIDRLLVPTSRNEGVACLTLAPGEHGPVIVSGHFDGTYRVSSLHHGFPRHRKRHATAVKAVAWSEIASAPCAAAGDDTGKITLRHLDSGATLRTLHGHRGPVRSLAFSELASLKVLISGSRDGTVRIWDPANGTQLDRIDLPDFVQTIAHRDGILAVGYGREVSVFTPNSRTSAS